MIEADKNGDWIRINEHVIEVSGRGLFEVRSSHLRNIRLSDLPLGCEIAICYKVGGERNLYRRSPICSFERLSDSEVVVHMEIAVVPDEDIDDDARSPYLEEALAAAQRRIKRMGDTVSNLKVSTYDDSAWIMLDLLIDGTDNFVLDAEDYVAGVEEQILNSSTKPLLLVCHAPGDRLFVERLVAGLDRRALYAWYDKREIVAGESITEKVNEALAEMRHLIVVLSPRAVIEPWVNRQLNSTLMRQLAGEGVGVLPVLLETCIVPPLLADIKHADFRRDFDDGLADLISAIRSL